MDPYSNGGAGPATGTVTVPALAAQYVPGVGIKYTAIAPNNNKLQGKYNAKTKKYKAYEKAKYAPWNYVRQYDNRKRYLRYWYAYTYKESVVRFIKLRVQQQIKAKKKLQQQQQHLNAFDTFVNAFYTIAVQSTPTAHLYTTTATITHPPVATTRQQLQIAIAFAFMLMYHVPTFMSMSMS